MLHHALHIAEETSGITPGVSLCVCQVSWWGTHLQQTFMLLLYGGEHQNPCLPTWCSNHFNRNKIGNLTFWIGLIHIYKAPVPRPGMKSGSEHMHAGIKSGSAHMHAGKNSDEVKINIFRDRHRFNGKQYLNLQGWIIRDEDGKGTFLQNVSAYVPDYTASYPKRLLSQPVPWKGKQSCGLGCGVASTSSLLCVQMYAFWQRELCHTVHWIFF